jgi:hypothetical protein
MKCPHCGYEKSLLHRGRDQQDGTTRRWRECRSCSRPFQTLEVAIGGDVEPAAMAAAAVDMPPPLAVVPDPPAKKQRATAAFWPVTPDHAGEDLCRLPAVLQEGILQWWNESRRSKWGSKASWTERAFSLSVNRVIALALGNPKGARLLVEGGIEHGWQALKPEYLRDAPLEASTVNGAGPMPKDPAMRSALEPWPAIAS